MSNAKRIRARQDRVVRLITYEIRQSGQKTHGWKRNKEGAEKIKAQQNFIKSDDFDKECLKEIQNSLEHRVLAVKAGSNAMAPA